MRVFAILAVLLELTSVAGYRISWEDFMAVGASSDRVLVCHPERRIVYEHVFSSATNRVILEKNISQILFIDKSFYLVAAAEGIYTYSPPASPKLTFANHSGQWLRIINEYGPFFLIQRIIPGGERVGSAIALIDPKAKTIWEIKTDKSVLAVGSERVCLVRRLSGSGTDYEISCHFLTNGTLAWKHVYPFAVGEGPVAGKGQNLVYEGELLVGTENAIHRLSIADGTLSPAIAITSSLPISFGLALDGSAYVFGCHTLLPGALYRFASGGLHKLRDYRRPSCFSRIEAVGTNLVLTTSVSSAYVNKRSGEILWQDFSGYRAGGERDAILVQSDRESVRVISADFITGSTNVLFTFPRSSYWPSSSDQTPP